jgi:transcription initiation factor TFIID subunit TAF12
MEMDKVSGGRCNPGGSKKRPRPSFHDSNANSMAANIGENDTANSMAANVDIDKTQNALWWKRPD